MWKKWLSYFFEIHVESLPSAHNPHLYVSLQKGRYQLSTANAIYSFEDLYDNFSTAFELINLQKLSPKNVLILGGGLLSVPIILESYMSSLEFTVIEYDENVSILAAKYALPKIKSAVNTIITDAELYTKMNQESFDLIVMDLFNDDKIPAKFETTNFLRRLEMLLNPKGLIMYNRLSKTTVDLRNTRKFYNDVFNKYFNKSSYLDVQGNWILLNTEQYLKQKP